jgi:hypothetical protein
MISGTIMLNVGAFDSPLAPPFWGHRRLPVSTFIRRVSPRPFYDQIPVAKALFPVLLIVPDPGPP